MNMFTQWDTPCTKKSGELRSQFQQWAIPKQIRLKLGIEDGDLCTVCISHQDFGETLDLKVTSGGELLLPRRISEILKSHAAVDPKSLVSFKLSVKSKTDAYLAEFDEEVVRSRNLPHSVRLERLAYAARKPSLRTIEAAIFIRNPDVVAEVLHRANGSCERCGKAAPFIRRSDGTPYLEVHHILQLAHDGEDSIDNAQALCPNCHRQVHHGR